MGKRKLGIFGLIIVFAISGFLVILQGHGSKNREGIDNILKHCPRYDVDVTFYPDNKTLVSTQRQLITNNTDVELKELYFHIYPNAFKNLDSTPFPLEEQDRAYPTGFAPGYINVKDVTIDTRQVDYEIEDTFLKVILNEPFKPHDKLQININFSALIPPSHGRYGYGENTYNIANWYPILAVYDVDGWHKDPYYDIGDPFYSDVALYNVKIKAPKEYTIAASGSLAEKREEAGFYQWEFKTDLVRDFAWIASSRFNTAQTHVGKTTITSYFIDEDEEYGQHALEYGKKAIGFFNGYFGVYPYDDFAVVASDFYIGGMEYPNLVMIGRQFYTSGNMLEYIVVHETAHQWWYGLVGNDEVKEPWLDEAITEYSTILYYENMYGKRTGQEVYEEIILNPYRIYELNYGPRPILRPLSEFSSWSEYGAVVYSRGAIMLKELERRMGKGKLQEALRYYFKQNQYKNSTTDDFIEALNSVTGTDWREYINEWLEGRAALKDAA